MGAVTCLPLTVFMATWAGSEVDRSDERMIDRVLGRVVPTQVRVDGEGWGSSGFRRVE